jgi:hypothetical protein
MTDGAKSWVLALSAALLSCASGGTTADPETPSAVASVPPPPSSEPAPSNIDEPAPEPAAEAAPQDPPTQAKLPPQQAQSAVASSAPLLGQACPAGSGSGVDLCGSKGRVSIEVDAASVRLVRGAECKPEPLRTTSKYTHSPMACLQGDILYAANACIACRLINAGWSAKARIPELTAAQALEVQKQLALPTTKPLRSVDEWKRALAAAHAP